MELRLPLEMSPGREAACRAVFVSWGFFRTMHGKTAPSCGLHSQGGVRRGVRAAGSYQEGTGKSGSYGMWNHPRGHVWNAFVRPASSRGATGRSGTPSRQSRGGDPPVQIRRGGRAQRRGCRKSSVFLSRETGNNESLVHLERTDRDFTHATRWLPRDKFTKQNGSAYVTYQGHDMVY